MSRPTPFWSNRRPNQKTKKDFVKFHASIDKETTLSLYKREGGLYLIYKKDLSKFNVSVSPSEAPIINQYLKQPDPFESLLVDIKIIEEEIMPLNLALQTSFGENKEFALQSVKVAIGSGNSDYVTIDETDLKAMDVEPTISGLLEFVESNKEGVVGICDRIFDHEKGNILLLEAILKHPENGISTIELKILSSLQQRGLYMQQNMKYTGIQMYLIFKAESITDNMLEFLSQLGVNTEFILLRRELSIEDWIEVECQKSSYNLKGYLTKKYDNLGFFDINNIVAISVRNQLPFKVVNWMTELLDRVKATMIEGLHRPLDAEPLKKAEIYAAAKVALKYFGLKKKLVIEKDIDLMEIRRYEAKLVQI